MGSFLTQMAISIWNELPDEVVEAGTTFKSHLDLKMDRKAREIMSQIMVNGISLDEAPWLP